MASYPVVHILSSFHTGSIVPHCGSRLDHVYFFHHVGCGGRCRGGQRVNPYAMCLRLKGEKWRMKWRACFVNNVKSDDSRGEIMGK